MSSHTRRKADHLDLAGTEEVAFKAKGTLLDQVQLMHDALPELHRDAINTTTTLVGHTLRAPLVIAGMTGGLDRAEALNKDLASVAQERGVAFGFGSMRPLLEHGVTAGYHVRDVAPDALLFGNIGVMQAASASLQALEDMVGSTGVNALCVHLNPGQEVVQPGGDEDFRGGLDGIARLVQRLSVPVIVKETGCGLSRSVGQRLAAVGVKTVDVGGAGGTSWVGVETLRARAPKALGELFWDWGIPTAASVGLQAGLGLEVIATGGVKNGLDIARAIALGARAGGMARPFLMAWNQGGRDAVDARVVGVIDELRTALLLTGSATPAQLAERPVVLGPDLQRWLAPLG